MELEQAQIEATIVEFAQKLERLRVSYDQYFLGISKREPSVQLKEVVRLMYLLDQQKIRNTRLRFRFRTTVQKFNTLRTQWNRTLRQIEAGTYHRDVAKMRRKMARQGLPMPSVGAMRSPAAMERAVVEAVQNPGNARAEVANAQHSSHSAATEGSQHRHAAPEKRIPTHKENGSQLARAEIESIYRRFVKAKRMCGEDTNTLKYESIARSINNQLPKLRQANPGKNIEFQVVIRSGRAVLKAVTKAK